ncbi:MAG: hypothetical protein U1F45_18965 [Burkholderiales bacterium]
MTPSVHAQLRASWPRLAMKRSFTSGQVISLALCALICGCTDGATRIAYDIESGVTAFERSDARTFEVRHVPERMPDGCAGAYTVQFSARSSLIIWCMDSAGGKVTSSHATTYHLRFVQVPRTFRLDKAAGEPTVIELAKENGAVVVTGVR